MGGQSGWEAIKSKSIAPFSLGERTSLAHRGFCHVDADEEDELSDEEVDAQILVDGVAVALQAPEEAEGENADGEADQRHYDADAGDDGQEQLVAHVDSLRTEGGGG